MQTSISQYIRGFTLFLLALLGISIAALFLLSPKEAVTAQKEVVKPGSDLYSISETIGQKEEILPNSDIKFVYDRQNGQILYGKGLGNQPEGATEFIGGTELWLTDEKQTLDQILVSTFDIIDAFFAPDGSIFYMTREHTLFMLNPNGSAPQKIIEKIIGPNLSMDGRKLVYQKLNLDWEIGEYFDRAIGLHIYNLESKKEIQLSKKWEDFGSVWTPKGDKILFISTGPEGLASHFIINEDGSQRAQLTNVKQNTVNSATVPVPSEKPSFSPDGRYLVMESDREIWLLEFNAGMNRVLGAKKLMNGMNPRFENGGKTLTVLPFSGETAPSNLLPIRIDLSGKLRP